MNILALTAQEPIGEDFLFFKQKINVYEKWLENTGLSSFFLVHDLNYNASTNMLELKLRFNTSDPDTAEVYWVSAKKSYDLIAYNSLESNIFKTFIKIMEITPDQANIQIIVINKTSQVLNLCTYILIWSEGDRLESEVNTGKCRSQPIKININTSQLNFNLNSSKVLASPSRKPLNILNDILFFVRNRFEKKTCYDRFPRVNNIKMNESSLFFTVEDLCKEVIKDAENSFLCNLMNAWKIKCNDMLRERLEFEIYLIPAKEGYLLRGTIWGKIGSGTYKPRKSAYMDMSPDFEEDYLEPYVNEMMGSLKKFLERKNE